MSQQSRLLTFFKGRVALHAILEAAGIGPGDRVILPGYTCVVVPNAILYRGAEPVYVDIDPETYNLDVSALADCIDRESATGKLKAIIAQHTYGLPADMPRINELAAARDLLVVEDACHALGSTIAGRQVGSLGQAAFFSSQWSKPLTTGLGGWARVNDPDLAEKTAAAAAGYPRASLRESTYLQLQFLAFQALYTPRLFWTIRDLYRLLGRLGVTSGSSSKQELDCVEPGDYRKRMGAWQARALASQLRKLADLVEARRDRGRRIEQALLAAGLPVVPVPDGVDPVWLRYPVRVGDKDEVLARAREARVEVGDWFLSPIHPNPDSWAKAHYQDGSCPHAERAARMVVNIPTSPTLSAAEIDRTVEFLARHGAYRAGEGVSA